jgi:hypothetical protein
MAVRFHDCSAAYAACRRGLVAAPGCDDAWGASAAARRSRRSGTGHWRWWWWRRPPRVEARARGAVIAVAAGWLAAAARGA